MTKANHSQQGFALLVVAVILFLGIVLGLHMIFNSSMEIQTAGAEKKQAQITFSSEGVLNSIAQNIRDGLGNQYIVGLAKTGGSRTFTLEEAGNNRFVVGGKQAVNGSQWAKIPEELEGLPRLLSDRTEAAYSLSDAFELSINKAARIYAVFSSAIAIPSALSSWENTDLKAYDRDGAEYRIRVKNFSAATISLTTEANASGLGISYVFEPLPPTVFYSGDSVKVRVVHVDSGRWMVNVLGSKKSAYKMDASARLSRTVVLGSQGDTINYFSSTLDVRNNLYFGRFAHEYSGKSPIITGIVAAKGNIVIDAPGNGLSLFFGYDFDNADGDAIVSSGIDDVNTSSRQETAYLYTLSGLLTPGPSLSPSDKVYLNTSRSGHLSRNYAANTSSPDYLVDVNDTTLSNRLPSVSNVSEFIGRFHLRDSASSGGIIINSLGGAVTSSWFFDWNVKKKVNLWVVDVSALSIPSGFNGFIYIERKGTPSPDEFYAVKLINLTSIPSVPIRDQKGRIVNNALGSPRKGLTLATELPLYTQGSVNSGSSSKELAIICYSYTLLSTSWEDALSRWSAGDTEARERSLYLMNQQGIDQSLPAVCNRSDLSCNNSNKGCCETHWAGAGVYPTADKVSNWYFTDRNCAPLRREPRNTPGSASSLNQWNHFDSTTVHAAIVTGYSLPDEHNPPNSVSCAHSPSIKRLVSDNVSADENYSQIEVRFGDAIRFLEAWQGRNSGGPDFNHVLRFKGSLNLLWKCNSNKGLSWNGSLEDSHGLDLNEPLDTSPDWISEREGGAWHVCLGRQFKIGTAFLPEIHFEYLRLQPPGFMTIIEGSGTQPGIGGWRRDLGNLD